MTAVSAILIASIMAEMVGNKAESIGPARKYARTVQNLTGLVDLLWFYIPARQHMSHILSVLASFVASLVSFQTHLNSLHMLLFPNWQQKVSACSFKVSGPICY